MNEETWCKNILTLHRYRDFRVEVFYSDSPLLVRLLYRSKHWWLHFN